MIRKLILTILLILSLPVASQEATIISSHQVTYYDAIEIFSFREFLFSDGTKVKMTVLPRDHRSTRILAKNLGYSSVRFYEKAEAAFSAGRLNLLVVVDNERDAIKYISKTDGAIGYVSDYSIIRPGDFNTYLRLR